MKKINPDHIIFSIAALFITGCFMLAYTPRDITRDPDPRLADLALFVDEKAQADFTEVSADPSLFTPLERPSVFRKHTTAAIWLKFRFDPLPPDTTGIRYLHINNSNLEYIDIYFPDHPVVNAGKRVPASNIQVKSRVWNIPIPDDVGPGDTVYMRVRTNSIMRVPFRMLSTAEMVSHSIIETVLFGTFFGVLIAVFFINLFSWMIVRNKNFFLYLMYVSSLIVYHLQVHGFLYFSGLPFPVLMAINWIGLGGVGICMILFAQHFLSLKKRMRVIYYILVGFLVLYALQMAFGVLQMSIMANKIAYMTGFLMPLTIIFPTMYLYFKGHREVRYYLLAWCALFMGTLIWSTAAYAEAQIAPNYFFIIGTTLDSLLFTLAIFDHIRTELSDKQLIVEREKYYQDLSRTDVLTGLYNRRYLNELVKRLESDGELPPTSALIMVDLDNFKSVNDTYGHLSGDMLLSKAGTKIKKHIRRSDIACRYGGDEFLVYLPGASSAAAQAIADGIRNDILTDFIYSDKGEPIKITVSIGITESRIDDSFDGLFLRADAALYQAKKTGRNRVMVL